MESVPVMGSVFFVLLHGGVAGRPEVARTKKGLSLIS